MTFDPQASELNKVYHAEFDYDDPATALKFIKLAGLLESRSHHHSYKVGAVAFGIDPQGRTFFIPVVNEIPAAFDGKFGTHDKIGDGHPSIHAEMSALLHLKSFKRVSFAIGKFCCPTCFEGICTLHNFRPNDGRVDNVFFNTSSLTGLDPNAASSIQKWNIAKNMLKEISSKGKVGLVKFNQETGKMSHLTGPFDDEDQANVIDPISITIVPSITQLTDFNFQKLLGRAYHVAQGSFIPKNDEAAILIGQNEKGRWVVIEASASLPPGFTYNKVERLLERDAENGKPGYNFKMSALKRVMIAAIKEGVKLESGAVVTTTVPISGMQVNAIAYGLRTLITPQITLDPQNMDHRAFMQLRDAGIIRHITTDYIHPFMGNGHAIATTPPAPDPG